MAERELIDQCSAGDEAAARALFDQNWQWVYRLAYRILGEREDAEDAAQQAFVRAFERLGQFRRDAAFATWLRPIVVSVSLNLRKQVRRIRDRHHSADTEALPAAAAGEVDPALRSAVQREVDALPDRMRVILIMHDLEGYTHAEIADALRIAEATSRVHLTRARQRVRARLARVGITGVDHG